MTHWSYHDAPTVSLCKKTIDKGQHAANPSCHECKLELLKEHVEHCGQCAPHRGHMPLGFCDEGRRLLGRLNV